MSYLMLFHDSNGYANAPQCYVYAYYTLPVLLNASMYREGTRVTALSRGIVQVCTAVDPVFALRWRL
jgi:3-methyladenine DNA glycosylase Mpg